MKKFIVIMMLLVSSMLFAEAKEEDELQKMPDYFIGKYKLMAYTMDGKSYITARKKPSFAILETCMISLDDGEVQEIESITVQGISKNKKLDIAITFKSNKEVWKFVWDDKSDYITIFSYKEDLVTITGTLIMEIVKEKELEK